ncbi:hypothetical protein RSAG8_10686, partial [Rhizoctonia solani AG-8 WAC10335]
MNTQQKRPRVSLERVQTIAIEYEGEASGSAEAEPPKKRRGRPKAAPKSIETIAIEYEGEASGSAEAEPPKKRRGRPKAAPKSIEVIPQPRSSSAAGHSLHRGSLHPHLSPAQPAHATLGVDDGDGLPFFDDDNVFTEPPLASNETNKDGDKQKKPRHNKTPNDNLREWLDLFADDYLDTLYALDSPPPTPHCSLCALPTNSNHLYRCMCCIGAGDLCSTCIKSLHRFTPTHRIKRWDGSSWAGSSLLDIGHVLFLGHNGQPCPTKQPQQAPAEKKADDKKNADDEQSDNIPGALKLYIGDINGFTRSKVLYCRCPGALEKPRQLLAVSLFPCSHRHPESAMTLQLLEMYNTLTTTARTSAHKYYKALEKHTKPGFSADVGDRYRELMWTHRLYLHLLLLRRSGHKFPLHPTIDVHPGDQAFDCVACPRPGFNFEWFEVTTDEIAYFRIWISYDGNFRSVRKSKKVAQGDICLSDGLAYFSFKDAYKLWTESVPQDKRGDKPACDNHKVGLQTTIRWVGRDVTGVGMFSCTPHTCILPRGAVDFFQGEKFMYSDFGFASWLSYVIKRCGGLVPIGMTYDVMCHWITNFATRAKLLPASIAIPEDLDLVGAVPKWHLVGHQRDCFVRWSLDNMQHVGRMEGEGPERFWSMYNQMSGSMSEQSPGVRTDNANNIIRAWNEEKAFGMHETVPAKYNDAKKEYLKQNEVHNDLTDNLPITKIAEWEKEPIEPSQNSKDKKWESPMMDPDLSGGFRETTKEYRRQETVATRVPGRRPGVTQWLRDGIEIEHSIQNYNIEAKELGDSMTPVQSDLLESKQLAIQGRIDAHRKRRELFMEELEEPDHPRLQHFHQEEAAVDLGMPSSHAHSRLESAGLATLVELERELRRAMCRESLETVKRLLGAKAAAKRFKEQNIRGQVANTRANVALKDHDTKIRGAQWRYNNSYTALVQLGVSESDAKLFKELKSDHLVPLAQFYKKYAETVGHGRGEHGLSWIWSSSAVPNTEDEVEGQELALIFPSTGLKTEWFRSRERYKRWREQLMLLKREMVMTIRSFQKYEELWAWKSNSPGITPGMRAYAAGQAKFFAELAYRMLVACRKQLYDDTVQLKWASEWLKDNVVVSGESFAATATREFARNIAQHHTATPHCLKVTSSPTFYVPRPPGRRSPQKPKQHGMTFATLSPDNAKYDPSKNDNEGPKDYRPRLVKSRIRSNINQATEGSPAALTAPDAGIAPSSPTFPLSRMFFQPSSFLGSASAEHST